MRIYSVKDRTWKIENTNIEYQSKRIDNYRHQLSEYFQQYDFQWFVTLNLHRYDVEDCEVLLKDWNRKMYLQDHIQTSYVGVIVCSPYKGNHVHLLMVGKNRYDETLFDRDKSMWEREWDYIVTHRNSNRLTKNQLEEKRIKWNNRWVKPCHSLIEPVTTESVTGYTSCFKNTPVNNSESFELVIPPNKKLLNKFRKQ